MWEYRGCMRQEKAFDILRRRPGFVEVENWDD